MYKIRQHRFSDLIPNELYYNDNGFYRFIEMRNDYIATFIDVYIDEEGCEHDDPKAVRYFVKDELNFYSD